MRVLRRHAVYQHYECQTLADHLALDQFLLALERNLLLHIATALNMTVVGLAMFRFFRRGLGSEDDLYVGVGIVLFAIAGIVATKGILDHIRLRKIFPENGD